MMQAICVGFLSTTLTKSSLELICDSFVVALASGVYIYIAFQEDKYKQETTPRNDQIEFCKQE